MGNPNTSPLNSRQGVSGVSNPSVNSPRLVNKKSPANKSPLKKGRSRPKKLKFDASKYGDIRQTVAKSNPMLVSDISLRSQLPMRKIDDDGGILSPSKVDLNVIDELPENIRNEIIIEMRRSGQISRHNQTKQNTNIYENKLINNNQVKSSAVATKRTMAENAESCADSGYQCLLSPSQLDQSFLRALPDDVKQDVLKDAETIKSKRLSAVIPESIHVGQLHGSILLSPSQLDNDVIEALPVEIQREVMLSVLSEKRKRLRVQKEKEEVQQLLVPEGNIPENETIKEPQQVQLKQVQ